MLVKEQEHRPVWAVRFPNMERDRRSCLQLVHQSLDGKVVIAASCRLEVRIPQLCQLLADLHHSKRTLRPR